MLHLCKQRVVIRRRCIGEPSQRIHSWITVGKVDQMKRQLDAIVAALAALITHGGDPTASQIVLRLKRIPIGDGRILEIGKSLQIHCRSTHWQAVCIKRVLGGRVNRPAGK